MKKRGSIPYQINHELKAIFVPGESRHAAKERGNSDEHIYSIGTMRTYTLDCNRFAKWGKKTYGIKDIRELTPEHAREYLDRLGREGRSGGYLGRIASAIKKLALTLHGEKWNLGEGWHSDPHPERAYSPSDAQAIIADLRAHARDPQTANVVQLQIAGGLRVNEAVRLKGKNIDVANCRVHLELGTKGGKVRDVDVDPVYREFLQAVHDLGLNHTDGFIFQGRGDLAARTERAINAACERLGIADAGTHGNRKTAAHVRYENYLRDHTDDRTARLKLANDLGHGRAAVTVHYVARE